GGGGGAAPDGALVPPARPAGGAEVWMRGVSLGYPVRDGFTLVLEGIDLHLFPGERLAVVGASGCGKSTLLHALAGLLQPVRGSVCVIGGCPEGAGGAGGGAAAADRPRDHAAYMFQSDLLLPWKPALANAAFAGELALSRGPMWSGCRPSRAAREAIRERARSLLCEFGLGDALHVFPHQLSGGMRQRVALARTLALGRGLVLLDEPFGSLDALTRSDLRGWMVRVMDTHAATWVLVTHDVDEAVQLADRVVVLGGHPAFVQGSVDVTSVRGHPEETEGGLSGAGLRRAAARVHDLLQEGRIR
ncbi:MAG: ABC transporter ATP-binding protein, partial [Thermoleophilia bacterium]